MGLGKTLQSIGFIYQLIDYYKISRAFLVVVPQSTIENWKREFQSWTPTVKVLTYTGSKQSRQIAEKLDFYFDLAGVSIPKFNVCLVSFEILRLDFKTFLKVNWQAVIVDEGQRLKNSSSKMFKICSALRTTFRILLSGTPLQNNFDELYNLMEYLDPEKFGSKFKKEMELKRTRNLDATNVQTSAD